VPNQQMHQIGEVAEAVGLSLRTIRHYEDVGVVVPSGRSAGGFRLYTDADVDRLRLVKRMKPLNFSLEEIRDVLALLDDVDGTGDPDALTESGDVAGRLEMYAALAAERCERLRAQLAGALEFTDMLGRAVQGARRPAAPRR
jgi:MerR family copper efflux transcriptional regulator